MKPVLTRLEERKSRPLLLKFTEVLKVGQVHLEPGEECGAHDTGEHEEIIIVLKGEGEFVADGSFPIEKDYLIYVPPHTRHNLRATACALDYIYIVAPLQATRSPL